MEQGLAQSVGQPANNMQDVSAPVGMGVGQGSPEQMVQKVVDMLMQGADPDELLEQGIPMEVVQAAIEIILAQEEQTKTTQAAPVTNAGLAMTSAGM